jgi:ribonucleotide reductase alpha subunit
LEPWHYDIEKWLELKKNHGKEEHRARDLFYALWTPQLFFDRVVEGGNWSLFCPNEAKGLDDCWGEKFNELYVKYENTPGLVRKTVKARELFLDVVKSMIETGTPYILNKDECNGKSNQQNLGTIKSSNLCTVKHSLV